MKRLCIAILLIASFNASLFAAYLENVPQNITQPDGTVVHCFATGDEYYNWLHDANNYTIIRNKETGFFVYAKLIDDVLVPTSLLPGIHNPSDGGLQTKLNIPAYKVAEMRRTKFQIPHLKGSNGTTTTGTLNNIVIFIRFSDQSEYSAQLSTYDNAFNGTNTVSMYEYFKEVSADQLTINTHLFPETGGATVVSFQDSHARSYYKTYDATTNTDGYQGDTERKEREHTLLKNATEAVTAAIEATGLDFDLDNDGNVDNIAYIIQGSTEGWAELLWPHMWALYSIDVRISGARVWKYNFQLSDAFGVSVLCHEMFHSLGAPDLYRYDDKDITPVGPWDIMSNNRTPPQHMSAYMKMRYGQWFSSIPEITAEGTYSLASLSSSPFASYKISSPNSSEFFVLEYRKAEGRFETSVPGNGLIISRINASQNGNANGPPDEIYIYRPNGTTTENGSVWSAHYSSGTGRTEINDATNPSSFLMDGSPGGLNISNIGSAGATISFDVSFTSISFNPPTNLVAASGTDYIDLSWDLPTDGGATLTALQIYCNGNLLDVLNDPTATSYHDAGLSTGAYSYYMTAVYTAPVGESGLSNFASADIVEFLPDYIVQNLSINPQTANAGSLVEINGFVKNQGIDTGASTTAWIFLSVDSNYDNNDT
ncbi:MAG: M6 family metalloprotease domain-containing protein, partial [Bacteroidales bacterium]|nr:M6 family metalloprotease domain-containing protein [Bacteroidales bacterium]